MRFQRDVLVLDGLIELEPIKVLGLLPDSYALVLAKTDVDWERRDWAHFISSHVMIPWELFS